MTSESYVDQNKERRWRVKNSNLKKFGYAYEEERL